MSDGKGPVALMPSLLRFRDPGRDLVDFFPAEVAVFTGVRVQGADRDAGLLESGVGQHRVQQPDGVADVGRGDAFRHLADRDVGGDPGSPEPGEDVEFAGGALEAQFLGEPAQFILFRHAAEFEAGLVQRGEENGFHLTGVGHGHGALELVEGAGAGLPGHLLGRNRLGRGRIVIQENREPRLGGVAERNFDAGCLGCRFEFGCVGEDVDLGHPGGFGFGQQLDGQFRADAGGVAEGECDAGERGRGVHAVTSS